MAATEARGATRLSICIPTLNRAHLIGETLASIICQATNECEIVVSDNASTDNTEEVVAQYAQRFSRLRYIKQHTNIGLDRNFDAAVLHAKGEYCWLLGDDDLLKPGAIAAALDAIEDSYSLVLINGEYWNLQMSKLLISDFFRIGSDRLYNSSEADRLFVELGKCTICISCFVIRRDLWLMRDRDSLFGTMFIHVGVMFQDPLPGGVKAISLPLIRLRWGNDKEWLVEAFEIFFVRWPKLVWSLPLSQSTKKQHCDSEPWRRLRYLLPLRATGVYSFRLFLRWIRPQLRSPAETVVPFCVLLIPRIFVLWLYKCYSIMFGVRDALKDAQRGNSTLPDSLYPLIGLSPTE